MIYQSCAKVLLNNLSAIRVSLFAVFDCSLCSFLGALLNFGLTTPARTLPKWPGSSSCRASLPWLPSPSGWCFAQLQDGQNPQVEVHGNSPLNLKTSQHWQKNSGYTKTITMLIFLPYLFLPTCINKHSLSLDRSSW